MEFGHQTYEFIEFGAVDVTKHMFFYSLGPLTSPNIWFFTVWGRGRHQTYEFIEFGAVDVTEHMNLKASTNFAPSGSVITSRAGLVESPLGVDFNA